MGQFLAEIAGPYLYWQIIRHAEPLPYRSTILSNTKTSESWTCSAIARADHEMRTRMREEQRLTWTWTWTWESHVNASRGFTSAICVLC